MPKLSGTRITEKTVKNAKPREKTYDIRDAVLRGFILKIHPSGNKAFYAEWARGKRSRIGDAALITLERAREVAEQRIAAAKRGEIPKPQIRNQIPTLENFIDGKYKDWALAHQKTGEANLQRIRGAFPWLLDTKSDQITACVVEKWKVQRKQDGKSPATINRDLTMLRACLNKAVEWGYLDSSPLVKVKALRNADNKRVRFLSEAEEKRLINQLDQREKRIRAERISANHWRKERNYPLLPDIPAAAFADYLKPMVLLAINTGLRYGELSQLRWSDISLKSAPMLSVQAAFSKTDKPRQIPLNKTALDTLKRWKRHEKDLGGLVFKGSKGNRIKSVRTAWLKVLDNAKIVDFNWHDLRHHFASRLVMAGVDLNTVRELLGHGSLDMTLRYAHLAPEHKATAVALLDK
jgi:integrase